MELTYAQIEVLSELFGNSVKITDIGSGIQAITSDGKRLKIAPNGEVKEFDSTRGIWK